MKNNGNLIQLENLTKTYEMDETRVKALRGISYTIKQGDFVAIMGPSGSGKSTLMNILGCLDKPTEGKYYLDGQDISSLDKNQLAIIRNKKIGFVFQNFNLLSRTTANEIMAIFKALNQEKNITIILVTHDPDVAKIAQKRIYLRDGQIEKEENENKNFDSLISATSRPEIDKSMMKKSIKKVNTLKTIHVSIRALGRNKMRSFLTALGIIIGVGAVIAMVSIGQGAKKEVEKNFDSMGTNMLFVSPGSISFRGRSSGGGSAKTLTEADAKAIEEECNAVQAVSPSVSTRSQVIYGNKNWNTTIQGVGEDYPEIKNWKIAAGAFFDGQMVKSGQKICVLGSEVKENLFDGEDPIGQIIRIEKIPFKIIGVLETKGEAGGWFSQDDVIFTPYTTAQRRLLGIVDHVHSIDVSAVSMEKTAAAQGQIEELLRIRHKIAPGAEDDFNVRNMADIAEGASESTRILTILLGGIASVSLLVIKNRIKEVSETAHRLDELLQMKFWVLLCKFFLMSIA